MKHTLRLLIAISTGIFFSLSATAQENLPSVEKLSFMVGEWKGTGWMLGKDRKRKSFSQSEYIKSKANNQALMVDGLGYEIDSSGSVTDRVIHKAFGIISFNGEKESITMISFSELKGRMESEFVFIEEKKMYWSFKEANGATIKFTEDFSVADQWKEIGEISMNGKDWYKFFEMNLKRQTLD
tara:strand:+ start:5096 stop:5644 length:549 start_codon:yes stop_codon:yes gene_type:complete